MPQVYINSGFSYTRRNKICVLCNKTAIAGNRPKNRIKLVQNKGLVAGVKIYFSAFLTRSTDQQVVWINVRFEICVNKKNIDVDREDVENRIERLQQRLQSVQVSVTSPRLGKSQ